MAPLIFLMSLHTQQRSTLMAKNIREPSSKSFSPAQSESESLSVLTLPIWGQPRKVSFRDGEGGGSLNGHSEGNAKRPDGFSSIHQR